jgi:CubicO group peptidase (beta-lactamase class C family)
MDKMDQGRASAAPATEMLAELDRYIERAMKGLKAPGLSISLVAGKTLLLEKGYGWADRKTGRRVTADTIFSLGSISKLFTSTAIMKLVEAGKVDLDAPVVTYIPELSLKTRDSSLRNVTVRSMLTHHSGLPSDLMRDFFFGPIPPANHAAAFRELPSLLVDSTPPHRSRKERSRADQREQRRILRLHGPQGHRRPGTQKRDSPAGRKREPRLGAAFGTCRPAASRAASGRFR